MSERRPPQYDWRLLRQEGIEDEIVSSGYEPEKKPPGQTAATWLANGTMIVGYAIILLPLVAFAAVVIGGLGVVFFIGLIGFIYVRSKRRRRE